MFTFIKNIDFSPNFSLNLNTAICFIMFEKIEWKLFGYVHQILKWDIWLIQFYRFFEHFIKQKIKIYKLLVHLIQIVYIKNNMYFNNNTFINIIDNYRCKHLLMCIISNVSVTHKYCIKIDEWVFCYVLLTTFLGA